LILNLPLLELLENPDLASRHLLIHIPDPTRQAEALASLAVQDEVSYVFPAAPELIQGQTVGTDQLIAPVAPGLLVASGEVLGQLVSTVGDGWGGPGRNPITIYYFFSHLTAQLPDLVTQSEILRALAEWTQVAQITWLPGVSATADRTSNILFATYDHGDGFPFDGPGGVLAHTFYPAPPSAEPLAGDMHFDDSESWHVGSYTDLFSVAVHEAGHALGLGSSDNPDSVMYPYYKPRTGLSDDDKAAILSLYAARTGTTPGTLALSIDATSATTTSATVSLTGTVTGASGTPTVTWTNSGGATGTALLTGASWAAASIPLTVGFNTITVTATDATGSTSSTVGVTRQTVTPPPNPLTLTINVPPATTTSAAVSLSGTVTGGSGGAIVTWSLSTGASGTASVSGTNWVALSIPLAIGLNSITITAADATGSVSQVVSTTRTAAPPPVGTDTAGPALTITYPSTTSLATTKASLTFKGTASDPSGVASVTWSTNTGGAGTASGTTPSLNTQWTAAIPLLVGFNQVVIRATDTAGNMSWRSVIVTRR